MAITPLPVGGTLFAGGGGASAPEPVAKPEYNQVPGASHGPMGGKHSVSENLFSPHSGMRSSTTRGDLMSRAMNHYGKTGGPLAGLAGATTPHPLKQLRGGIGNMRRIRGGLGPEKTGMPGSNSDYSLTSPDTE